MSALQEEIKAAEKKCNEAINKGDVDAVVGCYTDDAKILAPGSPMISGKAAIKEYFAGLAALGIGKSETDVLEVGGGGNNAYVIYNNTLYKADGSVFDNGKGLALYYKDNGVWKIYADSANSNAASAS
ncbi:expressed hypothetical protein [Trichoplax adhaerens]|uniref:DUF4440 domain-containing protein n=1 Tax=Trichoplax adhaerens TaxID=10228 RepID=B3RW04_TRIAD|nr:expressed hypothetical protein [Trichoplax adhaerens]EDV25586.1 expressed hypothetical protein [Trichoplax adhaerens]|eukprot:XP_002111619.1 expressed hypothetical protein [Trichoplax adhaerens]